MASRSYLCLFLQSHAGSFGSGCLSLRVRTDSCIIVKLFEGEMIMFNTRLFLLCFLVCGLTTACVSKTKFTELESDYESTRSRAEKAENDLKDLEEKYNSLKQENEGLLGKIDENEKQNLNLVSRVMEIKQQLQKKDEIINEMTDTRRNIEEGLKKQIAAKQIRLEEIEGKLKITFVDKILFSSGSATINKKGRGLLMEFANSFKGKGDQNIVVEGHTDNLGVGRKLKKRFPTNWELSTARAVSVVRFLQDRAGLESEMLSASGYSYYKPLASNDTEEGRGQNRRIEIILVPIR